MCDIIIGRNIGHLKVLVRVSYNGTLLISNVYETTFNADRKTPKEAADRLEKRIRKNAKRMIKSSYDPERLIVSIKRLKDKV